MTILSDWVITIIDRELHSWLATFRDQPVYPNTVRLADWRPSMCRDLSRVFTYFKLDCAYYQAQGRNFNVLR